jgi:TatD DNase family protein
MLPIMSHEGDGSEPSYADSHAHLDRYADAEVEAMVTRAEAAGVRLILTVGHDASSSHRAAVLAARYTSVEAAAGLHPLWVRAETLEGQLAAIRRLLDSGLCPSAVGEIGLDGSPGAPDFAWQLRAFAAQLALADAFDLPVVVHAVRAHREAAAVLRDTRTAGVIIHYFDGNEDELGRYLELDCLVSFGRLILKLGQQLLRSLSPFVPLDHLLAETDTYPLPGRSTEPRDVVDVVRALAETREEPLEDIASAVTGNLRRVLRLDD